MKGAIAKAEELAAATPGAFEPVFIAHSTASALAFSRNICLFACN